MKRTLFFLMLGISLTAFTLSSAPSLFTATGVRAQATKPAEVKIDPESFR
jgi:hypothetical protein